MSSSKHIKAPSLWEGWGRLILASFIFFTRLPFWRIAEVPKEYYERVVPLWPLVGWLTGGVMAGVFYVCQLVLPMPASVIAALVSRVLITGALHEDGFADFCDGMGGGTTRERTLEIMKDSHIGTYGVLGLILYYILIYNVLVAVFASDVTPLLLLMVDAGAKMVSSSIVWFLPYARKASEAKNRLIYTQTSLTDKIVSGVLGVLPVVVLSLIDIKYLSCGLAGILASVIIAAWLFRMMHRRINGYTGDCCGATFIITETTFWLAVLLTIA